MYFKSKLFLLVKPTWSEDHVLIDPNTEIVLSVDIVSLDSWVELKPVNIKFNDCKSESLKVVYAAFY